MSNSVEVKKKLKVSIYSDGRIKVHGGQQLSKQEFDKEIAEKNATPREDFFLMVSNPCSYFSVGGINFKICSD